MINIRIGLCLLIVFVSACVSLAQDENIQFSSFINTDLSSFNNQVESNSRLMDEQDWEELFSSAKKSIFDGNYTKAADYAAKCRVLAQTLNNPFLEAKSYRLSGEIKLKKKEIDDALNNFHLSRDALIKADKMPQNIIIAEYALLMLDVVETQAIDRTVNSNEELAKAFLNVLSVIKYCEQHPDEKVFNDIKITALIKQARIMEIEEHYPAEITLLGQIDAKNLASSNRISDFYELNSGLLRAYRALGNYEKAFEFLRQIEKVFPQLSFAEKSWYLRELAEFYTDTNDQTERDRVLDNVRQLAEEARNKYYLVVANSAQMLVLMQDRKFAQAEKYLFALKELSKDPEAFVNRLDLTVAEAVFASVRGDHAKSAKDFLEADKILEELNNDAANARFLFYWKSFVAANESRYEDLRAINLEYLKLAQDTRKIDSLPNIYFNLAKSSYELKDYQAARQYNEQVLALIEQKRNSKYANISIGVAEVSHRSYELQTSLNLLDGNSNAAFQIAEKSKGQFLADRLSGAKMQSIEILESAKGEMLEKALAKAKNPRNKELDNKLSEIEKSSVEVVGKISDEKKINRNFITELQNSAVANDTQIISYAFNTDDKLIAFTWTRRKGLIITTLDIPRSQIERAAFQTSQKIQNNLYFKQTGKELFDLLLKPLNLSLESRHLIIIPDGSLWKIPFQAMSAQGEKYLIEEKQISYAPSVPILLAALKGSKAEARTAAVFANSNYQNTRLAFADREAEFVAAVFGSKPVLEARVEDFKNLADKAEILHFSMHSEVDRSNPLDSFLAFQDGKVTVGDLLDLRIKRGSLVFLASCNTDNVYNSEGLVSLAWGMTAAGAGAVISSQWEAEDEAAGMFAQSFYANYKKGMSRAEAIQHAAIEMINNKAGKNKPYYWAEFFLMGDYR